MYISKITLNNFKSYRGEHVITCSPNINFFVGNNNCGKTTIFHAVNFIESGGDKDTLITKNVDGDISVEIELRGDDIHSLIDGSHELSKYQSYICNDENGDFIRIKRSSEENTIIQNNRNKLLSIKQVRVYNPDTRQFENPTGIDKTIGALFDAQFIWADSNNDEFHDFSKTKILGRLINEAANSFMDSPSWNKFKEAHEEAFGQNSSDSIASRLAPIEKRIETILEEQYGKVGVTFNFELPQLDMFFKTGNVNLSDNGVTTESSQKGTGLQRALALALVQVYAGIDSDIANKPNKPFLFFLDEPETYLHPQAQSKLLEALVNLSHKSQIFITTHSPYLLRSFNSKSHLLYIFEHKDNSSDFSECNSLHIFPSDSPTWGEINYFAFQLPSIEFHNELFGYLHLFLKRLDQDKYSRISDVDDYLAEEYGQPRDYIRFNDQSFNKDDFLSGDKNKLRKCHPLIKETLPTHIRNIVDHPEAIQKQHEMIDLLQAHPDVFHNWTQALKEAQTDSSNKNSNNNYVIPESIDEIKQLTNTFSPKELNRSIVILQKAYECAKKKPKPSK